MDIIGKSKNLNDICESVEQIDQIYRMIIDNKRYWFKPALKDQGIPYYEGCFNELLVSYIAKYLGIDCTDVQVASYNPTNDRFKKEYGILMEDYNIRDYVPYLGSYFLEQYYERLIEKNNLNVPGLEYDSKEEAIEKMNNLRTIYVALTYFFSEYADRDIIVENIMRDLTKVMCLDYLTMQNDRNINNWGILLSIKETPKLIKACNNEMAFDESFTPKLKTLNSYETKEETLLNLLELSDIYKTEFIDMYNMLTVDKLREIIEQIEMENGAFPKVHKRYKERVIKRYSKNYDNINKVLSSVESRNNYAR